MYSPDYTREVGLDAGAKVIPWPYAIAILAAVAAGAAIAVNGLNARQSRHEAANHPDAIAGPGPVIGLASR
jgi:hypothetical protein